MTLSLLSPILSMASSGCGLKFKKSGLLISSISSILIEELTALAAESLLAEIWSLYYDHHTIVTHSKWRDVTIEITIEIFQCMNCNHHIVIRHVWIHDVAIWLNLYNRICNYRWTCARLSPISREDKLKWIKTGMQTLESFCNICSH